MKRIPTNADRLTANDFVHKMDWTLLKAQKIVLTKLQSKRGLLPSEHETIEGILNLFDTIQDVAVDRYGYDDNVVFNHNKMTLREAKVIAITGNDPKK